MTQFKDKLTKQLQLIKKTQSKSQVARESTEDGWTLVRDGRPEA